MAKKGFKLPGLTPLKQTAGNSFFTNLPTRDYGTSGAYANPQTYFGDSSLGADVVSSVGNKFADSITAASNKNQDSSVETDASGSDITISPTGQLPTQTTVDPSLESGSNPKLEERISKAEAKGNLKKAARLQAKQDRNIVRQTEGAKRIEARQDEKLDRVKARQEGLTKDFEDKNFTGRMLSSIPILMKNDSPNKFTSIPTSGEGMLATLARAQNARPTQAQRAAATSAAAGGTMGAGQAASSGLIGAGAIGNTGLLDPQTGFPTASSLGQEVGGASGGQTLNCTPVAMSYDPPLQANEKGGKKSVFNMNTKGMAETAFGTPAMRQASVGAPFQSNAFYAALNDAKEQGAKTFEVGNKTFDVK